MLFNLLAENAENDPNQLPTWAFIVIFVVLVALLVVWFFFSGRKNRQSDKEYAEQLEALAPGNKVKTVGGICGIVVEICDDNTVVIESGTDLSGKSRLKIDKLSIALTDAKGPTQIAREAAEAKKKEEKTAPAVPMSEVPAEDELPAPAEDVPGTPEEEPFEPSEELPEEAETFSDTSDEPAETPAETSEEASEETPKTPDEE